MSKLSIEDLAQRSINILDQLFPKASELFRVVSIPQQVRQLKNPLCKCQARFAPNCSTSSLNRVIPAPLHGSCVRPKYLDI